MKVVISEIEAYPIYNVYHFKEGEYEFGLVYEIDDKLYKDYIEAEEKYNEIQEKTKEVYESKFH